MAAPVFGPILKQNDELCGKFNSMNKSLLFIALFGLGIAACNDRPAETQTPAANASAESSMQFFGDSISPDGAIQAADLPAQLAGKDSLRIKVSGTVEEVCQKKGCWLDMKIGDNQVMKVTFKDYGFFVPKDASGKTVIIDGYAYTDTVSVAELRHYAEDAGKSKQEIGQITAPEISISFEANGVIIKK